MNLNYLNVMVVEPGTKVRIGDEDFEVTDTETVRQAEKNRMWVTPKVWAALRVLAGAMEEET